MKGSGRDLVYYTCHKKLPKVAPVVTNPSVFSLGKVEIV